MTASLIQANRGQPQNMQPNNIPFMNTNMMPNQMMQRTRTSKFESETFINSALAMQPSGPNITMPPQNNMNMMRGGWPPGGQHQMPNQRLVLSLRFFDFEFKKINGFRHF